MDCPTAIHSLTSVPGGTRMPASGHTAPNTDARTSVPAFELYDDTGVRRRTSMIVPAGRAAIAGATRVRPASAPRRYRIGLPNMETAVRRFALAGPRSE